MTDDMNIQRQPRTKTISDSVIFDLLPQLIDLNKITKEQKELLEHYEQQRQIYKDLWLRRMALLALIETAEKQLKTIQEEYTAIDMLYTKAYNTHFEFGRNSLIAPLFKEGRRIIMEEEKKKMVERVRAFNEEQRLKRWEEIKRIERTLEKNEV